MTAHDPTGNTWVFPPLPGQAPASVASDLPLPDFVRELSSSRILDPELAEEVQLLQARCPNVRGLAEEMGRRGWLTFYQYEKLLDGQGQRLRFGPYVLLDLLGEGGMGQIFKARHSRLDRLVALKVLRPDRVGRLEALQRFQREARAIASLSHPNIVTLFDADEVDDIPFLAMEYIEGVNLDDWVRMHGPLPIDQACEYCRQAAVGLQHAHEHGLVHRDVKPANLMVTAAEVVKLLDLGLVLLRKPTSPIAPEANRLTGPGAILGTPDYIAPEQTVDLHAVDIRADLYSLGCTLYHLLTGQPPFNSESDLRKIHMHRTQLPPALDQLRPEVSPRLAALVYKLLAKKPEERYATPAMAATALAEFTAPAAVTPLAPPAARTTIADDTSVPTRDTWSDPQRIRWEFLRKWVTALRRRR